MNAQTLLLDSFNIRWDKYNFELKTCRREFSEEAVHDFRVALRRLLAFLDLLRHVMQDPRIQKVRRTLKDQLDDLDDLRDIQALLADLSEIIHETPALHPFQKYLQRREKRLMRVAHKEIKSLKTANLSKRIQKINKSMKALQATDLNTDLFSAVDEAFAVVIQRYTLIDSTQPATIHRLRIAFKKFRYMIEVIYPALQNPPSEYLKELHEYQATLGDIQDMQVALQELADFGELAPVSYDPEPALSYYKERHAVALLRYIEDKGQVVTFWRDAPDQSFPQEN